MGLLRFVACLVAFHTLPLSQVVFGQFQQDYTTEVVNGVTHYY